MNLRSDGSAARGRPTACSRAASRSARAASEVAETVNQRFNVTLASQAISFGALPTKTYGNGSFTLSATASSGLPVSYTSSDSAVASVSGNTVTITIPGPAGYIVPAIGSRNLLIVYNMSGTAALGKTFKAQVLAIYATGVTTNLTISPAGLPRDNH